MKYQQMRGDMKIISQKINPSGNVNACVTGRLIGNIYV